MAVRVAVAPRQKTAAQEARIERKGFDITARGGRGVDRARRSLDGHMPAKRCDRATDAKRLSLRLVRCNSNPRVFD